MSVSPYSVQNDLEVQEYNKRRAAWKMSEKRRKQEEKRLRDQAKQSRKEALKELGETQGGIASDLDRRIWICYTSTDTDTAEPRKIFGWLFRKSLSKTDVVEAKKLDDDSDSDSDEIPLRDALATYYPRGLGQWT